MWCFMVNRHILIFSVSSQSSRYLATNDNEGDRDFVLKVAYMAWGKWENKEDAPLIHAYILSRGSDQDLWNGEFQNGLRKAHEALKLALKYLAPDDERVVQYYSDCGIAFGSTGNYQRGADYLGRAEECYNRDPKRYGIAKGILINANMCRNAYCNDEFEDAEKRLNRTLEMCREMGSLYWEALYVQVPFAILQRFWKKKEMHWPWSHSIHLAFCSFGLRSGNLDLAECHLVLAKSSIEKFSSGRTNNQLDGMYAYLGGRIKLCQGSIEESMSVFPTTYLLGVTQLIIKTVIFWKQHWDTTISNRHRLDTVHDICMLCLEHRLLYLEIRRWAWIQRRKRLNWQGRS